MWSTLCPCRPAVASQRCERFAQHARLDHHGHECVAVTVLQEQGRLERERHVRRLERESSDVWSIGNDDQALELVLQADELQQTLDDCSR